MMDLKALYKTRFSENDSKNSIWKVLCENFFQNFVDKNDTVVDIAAGYCEFINNIEAREKIAFDLNPDIKNMANNDVKCINESVEFILNFLDKESINVAFVSSFFEHLDRKEQIIEIMSNLHKVLKMGGKVLILQPNIKYVKEAYWDFIDHKLPLTDSSLIEAGEMVGFKVFKNMPKFLPYTTKSKIPQFPSLVRLYLMFLPISSFFMGKQSFIILEK